MFDFLRDLTKSSDEKQRELLSAYLDDALTSRQRQHFEERLAQDVELQAALAQQRFIKQQMRQMPSRRVPRNFTLDPAIYGRPQRAPLFQLYPALRVATVLTAFFFILALALDLFLVQGGTQTAPEAIQDVAMQFEEAVEAPVASEAVEVTRVVTEVVIEESEEVEVEVMAEAEEEVVVGESVAESGEAPAEAAPMEEPAAEVMVEGESAADTEADESSPAPASAQEESSAISDDTATTDATRGTLQAAEPAEAPTPPPATATASAIPRPDEETEDSSRAVVGIQATEEGLKTVDEVVFVTPQATVMPERSRLVTPSPLSGIRLVQIGLGTIFLVLVLATVIIRRRQ